MTANSPVNEFDNDKFIEAFCSKVIKGWKGLTVAYLGNLIPIDESLDDSQEVEFSVENAVFLMRNSTLFDNWINKVVFDLDQFRNK